MILAFLLRLEVLFIIRCPYSTVALTLVTTLIVISAYDLNSIHFHYKVFLLSFFSSLAHFFRSPPTTESLEQASNRLDLDEKFSVVSVPHATALSNTSKSTVAKAAI